MMVPVHNANEGDRDLPIDVEVLPDVTDIVKQEVMDEAEEEKVATAPQKLEKTKKRPFAGEVRRSERLKHLKN